jgi:hypothetical protein
MTLQVLIDKRDNFEIIRDQIASLLVAEISNQQTLATLALKNPDDWNLRIFSERSNAWEIWLNDQSDTTPIVNVSFDVSNVDGLSSDPMRKQKTNATFNIDCYGIGISSDEPLSGHVLGDEKAAREAHRAIRLVRNILMAAENTYLQMRGIVGERRNSSIEIFQPQRGDDGMQQIIAARMQLEVKFNEFVDQYLPQTLEYVAIDVIALDDGQLILETDYTYPLP